MSRAQSARSARGGRRVLRSACIAAIALVAALLVGTPGGSDDTQPRLLRVGTSGDYPPFSRAAGRDGTRFEGFDAALASAFAADRGFRVEFVRFRWPRLIAELAAGRFDVAMSGVTIGPERSAAGRFTVPVVESGAVVVITDAERFPDKSALDHPRIRVGVNAGGHLESVARSLLPGVTLLAIPDNDAVLRALLDARLDAAVSDSMEAAVWQRDAANLTQLGPYTRDRKALLVHPEQAALAAELDAWLLEEERDGSLSRLRSEHLGEAAGAQRTATPLGALIAAVDERLALMPWIAVSKRRSGLPLEIPERETAVLDAAAAEVLQVAQAKRAAPPPFLAIRNFHRALFEAAKELQRKAARDPSAAPEAGVPDLETTLRPALDRIADRIARLVLELPRDLQRDAVREAVAAGIRTQGVSDRSKRAIADAIPPLGRSAEHPVAPSARTPDARGQ
ncbi:MAG: transporter substrate-binding domain-containing protein [Myxococcales bacterium]|nr:transporter substrate-binding domain-containing protein [Myxococcales bacterium]MDH5567177.1 transporter substrate-binding domain-containing protein [Myxococcales bacterium]